MRALLRTLEPAEELIRRQLTPSLAEFERQAGLVRRDAARADVYSDDIADIMDRVRIEYESVVPQTQLRLITSGAAANVERFNRNQLNKQMRSVLEFDVIGTDSRLESITRAFTRENVALIKSIPARFFDEVEAAVIRNFRQGRRAEDAAQTISERFGISESRAALIARDQTNKLNGELTRHRQTGLGISRYIWRTSLDERVRAEHQALEGQLFEWEGPNQPPDGHPGQPINCRCTAEPYLQDVFDELTAA